MCNRVKRVWIILCKEKTSRKAGGICVYSIDQASIHPRRVPEVCNSNTGPLHLVSRKAVRFYARPDAAGQCCCCKPLVHGVGECWLDQWNRHKYRRPSP